MIKRKPHAGWRYEFYLLVMKTIFCEWAYPYLRATVPYPLYIPSTAEGRRLYLSAVNVLGVVDHLAGQGMTLQRRIMRCWIQREIYLYRVRCMRRATSGPISMFTVYIVSSFLSTRSNPLSTSHMDRDFLVLRKENREKNPYISVWMVIKYPILQILNSWSLEHLIGERKFVFLMRIQVRLHIKV